MTSNLTLDALGPGNTTEGTDPSNDASNESLGIVMPSNTSIFLPSDNTTVFSTLPMDLIEDPPGLLAEINDPVLSLPLHLVATVPLAATNGPSELAPVVVAGYKSDDNLEEILHAEAGKEGPQYFDEDEVLAAGAPVQNIPKAQVVSASVNVPVPMSAAALKKLKKYQLCHQLTIRGVTFEKAKKKSRSVKNAW